MGDMFGGAPTPATPAPSGGGGGFLSNIMGLFQPTGTSDPGTARPSATSVPGFTGGWYDPLPTFKYDPAGPIGGATPGATPPTFPAPSGGGGFGINNILDLFGKGTGILSQIMALKGAFTQSPYEKLGENMIGASNKALKAYTSGKLTTTQQASVDQFKRQEMARWQQYLASAGIPASSAMVDISNKIEMDAQVYANQLLEQDFNNALRAMQAGGAVDQASQQALARVGQATNRLP